jgi:hypothetical protein
MSTPTPGQQATTKGILGVLEGSVTVDQAIANIDAVVQQEGGDSVVHVPDDVQEEVAPEPDSTVVPLKRARNRKGPRDPKNAEALAAAKKVKDALEPTPAKKAPAKKAPAKKAPEKSAPVRETSTVGPLPTKPPKLAWEQKDDGSWFATSGRWRYRCTETPKGWWAEQATGSWTPLHGDPQPITQAKLICETVDGGGAHWVAWARYRTQPWAAIVEAGKAAGK